MHCWGNNYSGQLGDGTYSQRTMPIQVSVLITGVEAIASGGSHSCALLADGSAQCWGDNWYGQLGNGTRTGSTAPLAVTGLISGAQMLVTGSAHTCALTSENGVKCWGNNATGQLGDGTHERRETPVDVVGLTTGVKTIAAGAMHTCAVTFDGALKCWGFNDRGQLGNGTTNDSSVPSDVFDLSSGVDAVGGGTSHTCGLTTGGGVKCWGANTHGQLGDGTPTDHWTPIDVAGLGNGVQAISAGADHTCALTTTGSLLCWGSNQAGQLGDNTQDDRWTPVAVTGMANSIQQITAGGNHTCALTAEGLARCWGADDSGQLGIGATDRRTTPLQVIDLPADIRTVAAGWGHTCALAGAGEIKCWGNNLSGQTGDSAWSNHWQPVTVRDLISGVQAIITGSTHTCAITAEDSARCWGRNAEGELGDGTVISSSVPVTVSGLVTGVRAVAAAAVSTCVGNGWRKMLGKQLPGTLGDGTTNPSFTPVGAADLDSDTVNICAGAHHICAITQDGGVKCWGANSEGQLGDGTNTNRWTPVSVTGLPEEVQRLGVGGYHSCAVLSNGDALCWGDNEAGQLGDGTTTDHWSPVPVEALAGEIQQIGGGSAHTCALTIAGGVKCWGSNQYGQLGDGTLNARHLPVDVIGLTSGVKAIAAGSYHTCATTDADAVLCWGGEQFGQLGVNPGWTPIAVLWPEPDPGSMTLGLPEVVK
ncbi:MAG: RCC1 repeat-containing protein [Anaerolineales bacterium]|nr:RCC1 repeat-containing protein [Anaerolineales bacterium]